MRRRTDEGRSGRRACLRPATLTHPTPRQPTRLTRAEHRVTVHFEERLTCLQMCCTQLSKQFAPMLG